MEKHPECSELAIELGCGKGRFTADTAESEPELFIAAVERVPEAIVVGMERAMTRGLKNIGFLDMDAADLGRVFAPGEADRIYVNFCDPWPSNGRANRRLTAPDFLTVYRSILKPGGQLRFKTDNVPLFDWSVKQFIRCGWEIVFQTHDLHKDGVCEIMTDYEAKFHAQGVPICKCVARRPMEEEIPMFIEEMRPTNILCLPTLPAAGERSGAEEAMLRLLKNAMDGNGTLNVGWLIKDGDSYAVDESCISTALIYDTLEVEEINRLLAAMAEPERLPGGRYAVFEMKEADFKKAWREMVAEVTKRGYALDDMKPVLWRISTTMLQNSMCELLIPVKSEV